MNDPIEMPEEEDRADPGCSSWAKLVTARRSSTTVSQPSWSAK